MTKNEDHPFRQEGEFTSIKKEAWNTKAWNKFTKASEALTAWALKMKCKE